MNKIILAIFGILVIFIAGIFVIGYFASKEAEKQTIVPSESEEPTTPVPSKAPGVKAGVGAESGISQLCAEYKDSEFTASCEESANFVLSKYPGNIFSIEKTQIDIPLPHGGEKTSELTDFWSISIILEESADRLEVMVDTTTGKIKILKQI